MASSPGSHYCAKPALDAGIEKEWEEGESSGRRERGVGGGREEWEEGERSGNGGKKYWVKRHNGRLSSVSTRTHQNALHLCR